MSSTFVNLMVCAGLTQAVFAQEAPASIAGKLLDVNGNAITGTGALIQIKNAATGAQFQAAILPDGGYRLDKVPAGMYDMTVPMTCCMYRTYSQKSVAIKAGEALRMDLHLEWGINLGTIGDDPVMLNNDMRAKAKTLSGPAPRTRDGKPDLSGMWVPVMEPGPPNPVPMQPWAAEIQKKLQGESSYRQGPAAYCLPQSAIRIMLPFPFKLVQTPEVIVHLTEFTTPGYTQIFLDGRDHPKDWNPAWEGHSIGKWEGDTLVVDTAGYNEITAGVGIHTEKLHVVQRIRRPDAAHLEADIEAGDPDAFTAVWKARVRAALVPDEEVLEFVCAENNKDPLHFGGLGYKGRP